MWSRNPRPSASVGATTNRRAVAVASVLTICLLAGPAGAKGPLLLFDPPAKVPFAYDPATPVPFFVDLGDLGLLTNAAADGLVFTGTTEWGGVPSATIAFAPAGDLPDDVDTVAEFAALLSDTTDVGITVVYDDDGAILSGFFGVDPMSVNGAGSPKTSLGDSPVIKSSWVILSGPTMADAADVPGFGGVVTHELGHAINLAHSQVNGGALFFGDADFVFEGVCFIFPPWTGALAPEDIETMNPFQDLDGPTGPEQATVDIADDVASVSDLYPASDYPAAFIEGTIFYPDGVTPITGVNVVARPDVFELGHPGAVTSISGDYTQGLAGPDGSYTLTGLTPDADYIIYVDGIISGAFSTPPAVLPGLEEYFNLAESSTDDICEATPVTAEPAGVFGVDIIFNAEECVVAECPPDMIVLPGPLGVEFCVLNCGPTENTYFVSVSDDSLWCSLAGSPSVVVPSGETICVPVDCDVEIEGGTSTVTWVVSSESGAVADSCETLISADIGVPVLLSGFRGTSRERAIDLEWTLGGVDEASGIWLERATGEVGPFRPVHDDALAPRYRMSHTDTGVQAGETYFYRVKADLLGGGSATGPTIEITHRGFGASALFSPELQDRTRAMIGFAVGPVQDHVRLDVLDVRGRLVKTLADEVLARGQYDIAWDLDTNGGAEIGGGVYFLSLRVGTEQLTRKMVVLR